MAKENEGVNNEQVAAAEGVTGQVAADQGVESQVAADDGSAAGGQQATKKDDIDELKIPRSRLNEEIAKKEAAEREAELLRQQMSVVLANQPQSTSAQPQRQKTTYEQAIEDCRIDPDYMTESDRIRVMARKDELDLQRNIQIANQFANQRFIDSHSDFTTVAGHLNPTGEFVPSAELQKILIKKPYLRASCTAQGAYEIVMEERRLAELTRTAQQHKVQQEVDMKTSPMSPAAAGGGAVSRTEGQITENSTAEDVLRIEQEVKSGKFG
jgi:hypothetical protein